MFAPFCVYEWRYWYGSKLGKPPQFYNFYGWYKASTYEWFIITLTNMTYPKRKVETNDQPILCILRASEPPDGEIPVDFVFLSSCHIFLKQQEMLSLRLTRLKKMHCWWFNHHMLLPFLRFFFWTIPLEKKLVPLRPPSSPLASAAGSPSIAWDLPSGDQIIFRHRFPCLPGKTNGTPGRFVKGSAISSVMSCRSHGDCP